MSVEKPYEINKNIRLSINDINSEEIKLLYDLTDVKIPSKFIWKFYFIDFSFFFM